LYSKKKLIIIDDGFSGLDAETEEKVFVEFFGQQGLLRRLGITAILVTHRVSRLSYADYVIALAASGQIAEQGTFQQLQNSGGYVEGLATTYRYEADTMANEDSEKSQTISADQPTLSAEAIKAKIEVEAEEADLRRPIGELSTYKYYFSSIGWKTCVISLFYLVVSGVATKSTELLLTYWTDALSRDGTKANQLHLGLYGMLAGVATIFWVIACYHFFLYLVPVSAEKLHKRLLVTVMNAPLYFFTSTDTGITANRFVLS
jgi:ATP-binding cassette, subfamily C (CFTR/MRP), member 1